MWALATHHAMTGQMRVALCSFRKNASWRSEAMREHVLMIMRHEMIVQKATQKPIMPATP